MQLSLDGTVFTITSTVPGLCDLITAENRGVLLFRLSHYSDTLSQIMQQLEQRYGPNSSQIIDLMSSPLHCGAQACMRELPQSAIAVAMGMQVANMPRRAGGCPRCGSDECMLIYEHFVRDDINAADVEAIGNYWLDRARRWWEQSKKSAAICDLCNAGIPRGGGYLNGNSLLCEPCIKKTLEHDALQQLRRNPHYFGSAILRKARPFRAEEF